MILPMRSYSSFVMAILLLLRHSARAEDDSAAADHMVSNTVRLLDEANHAGTCDAAVTERYTAIVRNLETQQGQQLEESRTTCRTQLVASEESVREYKELADQAQRETADLQARLQEELAAVRREATDNTEKVEKELRGVSQKYNELEGRHRELASELETALESVTVSRARIVAIQSELEQARQELSELQNQYINWQLFQRRYQEAKDAVDSFYHDTFLPFLVMTKDAIVNAYEQAVHKYRELCVALEPVGAALRRLWNQSMDHTKVAWHKLADAAAPHVETTRATFDATAGPHIAVAAQKLGHFKTVSLQKVQDSPVYPHLLSALAILEQVQRHISGGLQRIAKGVADLAEQHNAPERIVAAAEYVQEHSTTVAVYLEASIASLLVLLFLSSVMTGGRRRAGADRYTMKPKLKKA